jgi:hypothetical protein
MLFLAGKTSVNCSARLRQWRVKKEEVAWKEGSGINKGPARQETQPPEQARLADPYQIPSVAQFSIKVPDRGQMLP